MRFSPILHSINNEHHRLRTAFEPSEGLGSRVGSGVGDGQCPSNGSVSVCFDRGAVVSARSLPSKPDVDSPADPPGNKRF
jgi:hypothetical protein